MTLNLINMDDDLRALMIEEFESDISSGNLYLSKRFSRNGVAAYPDLMREAMKTGDDESLACALNSPGTFEETEIRNSKNGPREVRVPVTAPITFAEGEFNRYYSRAVCRLAESRGVPTVEVYRAKEVDNPRSASQQMIGQQVEAKALLSDLRTNIGVDTVLGLPQGPNSGLSVRLR